MRYILSSYIPLEIGKLNIIGVGKLYFTVINSIASLLMLSTHFSSIKWNFTKFIVDKNGQPVERFAPTTSPNVSKQIFFYSYNV